MNVLMVGPARSVKGGVPAFCPLFLFAGFSGEVGKQLILQDKRQAESVEPVSFRAVPWPFPVPAC